MLFKKLFQKKKLTFYEKVAEIKYGINLDVHVYDSDWVIRREVAKQGKEEFLKILVHDPDKEVRAAVAKRNFGLEYLVSDKEPVVRAAVAEQGYGLDSLVNDSDKNVQFVAKLVLERNNR